MEVNQKKLFKCTFCLHEFERTVRYLSGENNPNFKLPTPGKRNAISDQVMCPKCFNFIPTWDKIYIDGKRVKIRR